MSRHRQSRARASPNRHGRSVCPRDHRSRRSAPPKRHRPASKQLQGRPHLTSDPQESSPGSYAGHAVAAGCPKIRADHGFLKADDLRIREERTKRAEFLFLVGAHPDVSPEEASAVPRSDSQPRFPREHAQESVRTTWGGRRRDSTVDRIEVLVKPVAHLRLSPR